MTISLQVAVSGTVGKQVFPTSGKNLVQPKVCAILVTPSGANSTIKVRDGNASGEVVYFGRFLSAFGSKTVPLKHKFTKGMHVKLLGTAAEAYLIYD